MRQARVRERGEGPTYPILAAPRSFGRRRSPVNERKSRQECGRARAPRTLWRGEGGGEQALRALTWRRSRCRSLSPVDPWSVAHVPCLSSSPLLFTPSCHRALPHLNETHPILSTFETTYSRSVDCILRRKDTSLSCQFTSIRQFYFD